MKIALVQSPLVWETPEANRNYFEEKIHGMASTADLVVLPEMFATGFTMNPDAVAETMQGETVSWMVALAKAQNCAITGSLVIKDEGHFYNRLLFVFPSGDIKTYDKRHLFSLAGEDKVYASGKEKLLIEYKGFTICPLICYDLRFPVFSRNTEGYDVLIYVANWPKPRMLAWDSLLKARAIENMCYTIGVNRVGKDDNNLDYIGHSQVVDFLGNYLLEPQEDEAVFMVELDWQAMLDTRAKLNFLNDRDAFTLG
ncbi:amidohydrolase [Flavobacterium humi]|uniref:Omega-amidase YafV n=1 Tax=Flavobacterium humi TaxID=2562683 RepID=A0A4Z0LAM2_9FLAO|nr:amidohydrolase [Flavobacterium humi]TGD58466.1 amidohydrolase [Flavobacterium humi]